jgi:hypothetical protein
MLEFIYDIPTWSLGVLIVLSFTILPTLFLIPARSFIHKHFDLMDETNNIVGIFFSFASLFYGILLGLVVVSTWQNFAESSTTVGREATQLGALYRDISSYPEPKRSELQDILRDYTIFIIDVAMPAHNKGKIPSAERYFRAFQDGLLSFSPTTAGEQVLHAEALSAFNDLIKAKQLRIQSVGTGLPQIFWIVVLIGTLLTIAITYFLHIRDIKLHLTLTAVTGFLVGLLIFLTAALDNPFRGELSVDAEPYRIILDSMRLQQSQRD